jgi:hypothetical protein
MVERSRPRGPDFSRVIALWKDPNRGTREISLEAGAQGVLLASGGQRATRRSADGRRPVDNVTNWFDVAVFQVRAATTALGSSNTNSSGLSRPPALEVHEVTILMSFSQAVAEALAYAPERVAGVLADAEPGALWRAEFRIAEPSAQLAEAIHFIGQAVRAAMLSSGAPALDAVLFAIRDRPPEEQGLCRLARQVLRAMLEQRQQHRFHATK